MTEVFYSTDSEVAGTGTDKLNEEVLAEKNRRIQILETNMRALQDQLGFEVDYSNELERRLDSLVSSSKPTETISRIRVMLSRPLTWSEVEELTTDHVDPHLRRFSQRTNLFTADRGFNLKVAPNRQHVWVEGYAGSRILYDLVARSLDEHFVNVYPKAVRTFSEYNGE